MSNRIDAILDQIQGALQLIPDIRVYRDAGNVPVEPPGVVMGPPTFTWDGYAEGPTEATMFIYLVVKYDDRVFSRLFDVIENVASAIDTRVPDASVVTAAPSTYPVGQTSLPAYQFTVDINLQ
jgi:hypothetical protein